MGTYLVMSRVDIGRTDGSPHTLDIPAADSFLHVSALSQPHAAPHILPKQA